MLRIYLPSSTDLKLYSDVPIVNFVDTVTLVTLHLGPGSDTIQVPGPKFPLRAFAPDVQINLNDVRNILFYYSHLILLCLLFQIVIVLFNEVLTADA